jgi:hypothetical protein
MSKFDSNQRVMFHSLFSFEGMLLQ